MDFSQRLVEIMDKRNITAYRISKNIDISDRLIGYWKSGEKQPTKDNLIKLADYFGVSVDYLLGLIDDPAPPLRDLSIREKSLVVAYRGKPELQPVIDKILDVDTQ